MKKTILLLFTLFFAILGQAQIYKTVNITAGGLSKALTTTELFTVTNLTINGTIDARDFKTMSGIANVFTTINLSGANIVAYNGTLGTNGTIDTFYEANTIPQLAFYGYSKLTSITIPSSITSIGVYAFYQTGLTSINIPSTVTSIGDYAFSGTGLTSITIPSSVTSIGGYAFCGCGGLKSITIPTSFTSIGDYAFACSGLTSITIPSSVTSIGKYAFNDCSGLTSITIPSSVTSIGDYAFYQAGLTSITIPSSVTSIGDGAFCGCTGLTSITIPSSVTSINHDTFSGTGLTSITIPLSVTSIGSYAFSGCAGLTSITIPSSVTSIGDNAFSGCAGLTSITIPSSVTSIGGYAFYQAGLTSITIPTSVTTIGNKAFYCCSFLTSITIPSSVTSIGDGVFNGCARLTSIYAKSSIPIYLGFSPSIFMSVDMSNCTLYIPIGSKKAYQSAMVWRNFTNIVETQYTTPIPIIINASLSLYPNPTIDYFQINGFDGIALIKIKDLNGKALFSKQISSYEKISISSLCRGIYILEVATKEGTLEKKIVKN